MRKFLARRALKAFGARYDYDVSYMHHMLDVLPSAFFDFAALTKLAELDPRQVEIIEMRFFGGLTVEEVAEVLGVSKRTVESDWTMARAWLRRELSEDTAA